MKTITKEYQIFILDEVKDKAISRQWDINVDYEWWKRMYDDAAMVGIVINSFDIDRASYCNITISDYIETANEILKQHGECCDTYKLAEQFITDRDEIIDTAERNKNGEFADEYELDGQLDDLEHEFKQALEQEYLLMLRKEYKYLTSAEVIEETLRINEYEFYADGSIV